MLLFPMQIIRIEIAMANDPFDISSDEIRLIRNFYGDISFLLLIINEIRLILEDIWTWMILWLQAWFAFAVMERSILVLFL